MCNFKFWQNCRIYYNVWTSSKLVCTIVVCCFVCILDNMSKIIFSLENSNFSCFKFSHSLLPIQMFWALISYLCVDFHFWWHILGQRKY